MGRITDAKIRAFQEQAGIEPATGQRAALLSKMSKLAYDLIQTVALEQAGIRDGDGHWYGCDPIGSIIHELAELEREDLAAWRAASSPPRSEHEASDEPVSFDAPPAPLSLLPGGIPELTEDDIPF